MKKWIAILLAAMLTAMGAMAEPLANGWTLMETLNDYDAEISEGAYEAFEQVRELFEGELIEVAQPQAAKLAEDTRYLLAVQTYDAETEEPDNWKLMELCRNTAGEVSVTGSCALGSVGDDRDWQVAGDVMDYMDPIWEALDTLSEQDTLVYCYMVLNERDSDGKDFELLVHYALPAEASETEEDEDAGFEWAEAGLAMAVVHCGEAGEASVVSFEPIEMDIAG